MYKRKLYYKDAGGGKKEYGASRKIYYFFPHCKAQTLESILKDMAVIVARFYIILCTSYVYSTTFIYIYSQLESVAFGNSSSCNKISHKTAIYSERLGFCVFEYFM